MTEAASAPGKLFREEARTEAVQCLACGGPIALHGFRAVQRVICPACGSALAPEDSGALALLERAERQRQTSVLPLHARGRLDGVTWEILGICWRRCVVAGVAYPWQEFLLFNPYRGFRWLIYSMSDRHWTLGWTLRGAPKVVGKPRKKTKHHAIEFDGQRYRHFQSCEALVTYVEGEFTWEVRVGDRATIDDFVAPPRGISIEQSAGPDGVELNFTMQRALEPAEVWSAFAMPGKPPRPAGVGAIAPNRWREQRRALWLSCAALLVAWWFASGWVKAQCAERTVFSRVELGFDAPLSEEIEIGRPGERTAIDVSFSAEPLDNSWAFADVMLVNLETEEAIGLGLEASYYHGYEGGESWSEGDRQPDQVVGGVPGGRYLLQVAPERDTSALAAGPLNFGTRSPTSYSLRVRDDVYLTRYSALAVLVILAFPLFAGLLGLIFERRRWANSDYHSG